MKRKIGDCLACSSYLELALYEREKHFSAAVKTLRKVSFNTIVCTGVSGLVFAPTLAFLLKKQLVVVRKTTEGTHADKICEANFMVGDIGKWIFVDDFIESGATLKKTKTAITKEYSPFANYAGCYLYDLCVWEKAEK